MIPKDIKSHNLEKAALLPDASVQPYQFKESLSDHMKNGESNAQKEKHSSLEHKAEVEKGLMILAGSEHDLTKPREHVHLVNDEKKNRKDDALGDIMNAVMKCSLRQNMTSSLERKDFDNKEESFTDRMIEQENERSAKKRAAKVVYAQKLREQIEENSNRKILDKSEQNSNALQSSQADIFKNWKTPEKKTTSCFQTSIISACESDRSAIRREARAVYDQQLREQIRENVNRRLFQDKLDSADDNCNSFNTENGDGYRQGQEMKEIITLSLKGAEIATCDDKGMKDLRHQEQSNAQRIDNSRQPTNEGNSDSEARKLEGYKVALHTYKNSCHTHGHTEVQIEEEKRKQQLDYIKLLRDQINENAYRREKQRKADMEEELRYELQYQGMLDKQQVMENRSASTKFDKGASSCKRLKQLEYQKLLEDQIREKYKEKQRQKQAWVEEGHRLEAHRQKKRTATVKASSNFGHNKHSAASSAGDKNKKEEEATNSGGISPSRQYRKASKESRPQCNGDGTMEFYCPIGVDGAPKRSRSQLSKRLQMSKYQIPSISPLSHSTFDKGSSVTAPGFGEQISNETMGSQLNNGELTASATTYPCSTANYSTADNDGRQSLDSESVMLYIPGNGVS